MEHCCVQLKSLGLAKFSFFRRSVRKAVVATRPLALTSYLTEYTAVGSTMKGATTNDAAIPFSLPIRTPSQPAPPLAGRSEPEPAPAQDLQRALGASQSSKVALARRQRSGREGGGGGAVAEQHRRGAHRGHLAGLRSVSCAAPLGSRMEREMAR